MITFWLCVDIFGLAISAGALGLLLAMRSTTLTKLFILIFNLAFLEFGWNIYKLTGA